MWLSDLANGAPGGAVLTAAALLWQQKRQQRHADIRAEQDRKDAAERELRAQQRDKQAASREERKVAHTQALLALDAVLDITVNDQNKMMMQSMKNQSVQSEEQAIVLAYGKEYAREGAPWNEPTIEVLAERIETVALYGSPESARAAKAAQEAALTMYYYTKSLEWGTEISAEQGMELGSVKRIHKKAVAEYLGAVRADLGTDS